MLSRRDIVVETVMRGGTDLGDVWRGCIRLGREIPDWRRVATRLLLLAGLEVAAQVGLAFAAKIVIEAALSPAPAVHGSALAAGVAIAAVVLLVGNRANRLRAATVRSASVAGVRRLTWNVADSPYVDLAAVPMAELRELVMTDLQYVIRFIVGGFALLVRLFWWSVGAVAVIAWLAPAMMPFLFFLVVAAVGPAAVALSRHAALSSERFRRLALLSQRARDVVEVGRVVVGRQFGVGANFVRRFLEDHGWLAAVLEEENRLALSIRQWAQFGSVLTFIALVGMGAWLIAADRLTAGALVAMLFTTTRLLAVPLENTEYLGQAAEAAKASKRIEPYWQHVEARSAGIQPSSNLRIRCRDVSFAYPDCPPVVRGLDLELEPGHLASVTGATGSGKTTLALLMTGLLEPASGVIDVAPTGARPVDLRHGSLLYIGSAPVLVEGSVRDNLFLRPDASPPEALERFLEGIVAQRLPLDEPVVGPNGIGVSSGQAQLIQLARAIGRDPEAVVFDEATSALDIETEAVVQSHLLDWCTRRICLVVSHRSCPWIDKASNQIHLTG